MIRAGLVLLLCLHAAAEVRPTRLQVKNEGPAVDASLLIENGNDNTANLDVTFEVLDGSRTVAKAEVSLAAPPLLSTAAEARLDVPGASVWDPAAPHLYTLRTRMLKHSEAVEGEYSRELSVSFAILPDRSDRPAAASGVDLPAEFLRLLPEAGIGVIVERHPADAVRNWAAANGLVIVAEAPAGFERITRFVPEFTSSDGVVTEAYRQFRERHAPAVLKTITEIDGVTRIEVIARTRLRDYSVRVGNQEQTLALLEDGEIAALDFPSVNPYRVEIRNPHGFIVAER